MEWTQPSRKAGDTSDSSGRPTGEKAPDSPEKPAEEQKTQDAQESGKEQPSLLRRNPWLIVLAIILLIVAGAGAVVWWLNARHFESTDDAFIDARQFAIAPKVSGYIVDVPVTDNEFVAADALIAQIDPRDYQNALAQAEARRKGAGDQIVNIDAQIAAQQSLIDQAQAQVKQSRAALDFAQQQFDRAKQLRDTGAGTVQNEQQQQSNLLQAQADLNRAEASLAGAQKQIAVLQAQRANAVSTVSEAKAARDQAELDLAYTSLKAAQVGRIAHLTAARGQYVQPGQNISMFVPDPLWITANFKETQITDMRPGQAVDIEVDAYPDRKLRGHIDSIQPGSGPAFSILPPENATGNYVKVVQRVPVKIVFDDLPHDIVLGPGMSVVPTVRVR
ncbi:MAG: HlyD family secretion protein [Methylobacteriaceae bacterium]|nr:HlyD family secretion protein [Methylobacteriaceae bacterium]